MSPPISLAQSSFLLSSLLSNPSHRLDQRPLLAPRPFVLAPQVDDDEAVSTISIGQTTVSARLSTTVVKSTDHLDDGADDEGDSAGGVGIWSIDIRTSPGCQVPVSNGGNSSKTSCLELDASLQQLQHLVHSHLTSVFSSHLDQFIILPSTDPTRPLRGATYWNLSLDVVIHSMAGGNVYDAAWASIYAALWRARVPRTRPIAYEAAGDVDMDDVGIKSIKGKAVDYELVDVWDAGVKLEGREDLGVGLTIGMLPNGHHLIDPTLDEELCLPSSRRLFVVASQRLHATHLLPSLLNLTAGESTPGEDARLPPPPQPDANWEVGGWGTPSWQRVKSAIQVAAPMAGQLAETLRASLQKEEEVAKR